MTDLPASWAICVLGAVIEYGATQKAEPEDIPGDAWLLELEDIEKDTSKVLQRHTFDQRQSKSTKNRFDAGDVLYGKLRPYLNKVVRADQSGYCTTEIIPLKPTAAVEGGYLFHWLKHPQFIDYVTAVSHGLNMPRLGTEAGRQAPFVLAPPKEQKRIAHKLDAVLARVDACRNRLDRVPAILKHFRRSVLADATCGRLTAEWRGEASDRSAVGLPKTWSECQIKDAGRIQLGRQRAPKFHTGGCMRPYLRVQNVFEDRLDLSDVMEMDFPGRDLDRYQLHPRDILLNEGQSPEYLGRPAMYRGELPGACFTNSLIRFQAHESVNADYALLVFRHHMHSGRYRAEGTITTNIAHLSAGRFANIEFPRPPLGEQLEIVRRVESLFAWADRLEARYAAAGAQVERLTPALLAKAFRGELVPQDPADEPASELLERLGQRPADNSTGLPKAKGAKARRANAAQTAASA